MSYQFDVTRPIYLQIMEEIKMRSVKGMYIPGNKLPSVRDLAKELAVNPNTISRAYMELEREEFLFVKRGQGSFLTKKQERINQERENLAGLAVSQFIDTVKSLELKPLQVQNLFDKLKGELNVC